MGYKTKVIAGRLTIKNQNKDAVFKIWINLNNPSNNHLKEGGSGKLVKN